MDNSVMGRVRVAAAMAVMSSGGIPSMTVSGREPAGLREADEPEIKKIRIRRLRSQPTANTLLNTTVRVNRGADHGDKSFVLQQKLLSEAEFKRVRRNIKRLNDFDATSDGRLAKAVN